MPEPAAASPVVDGALVRGSSPSRTQLRLVSVALSLAIAAPAVIAGWILYLQRLPFPYQDDYKALLAFASDYSRTRGFGARVLEIATPEHNRYRLIFQHLVVAAQLQCVHRVDFAFLTAFGDAFLLGILYLFWRCIKKTRDKLLIFLPISMFFFSLSYWETLNWAMASLQNLPVIFFAFLSLSFLAEARPSSREAGWGRFFLACASALLSCCSSANGFLLLFVGLSLLVPRRAYARAWLWACSFVPPLWAYLYHPVAHSEPHHSLLAQISSFVAFFGSVLARQRYAAPFGLAVLLFLMWAARSRFDKINPVLFFLSIWIVLTGALTESIRASIASRYSIYSVMILSCCYVFLIGRQHEAALKPAGAALFAKRGTWLPASIAVAFCICVQADIRAYHQLRARKEMVIAGLKHYQANPAVNSPQMDPAVDKAFPDEKPFELHMLHQAAQDGTYAAPSAQDLSRR